MITSREARQAADSYATKRSKDNYTLKSLLNEAFMNGYQFAIENIDTKFLVTDINNAIDTISQQAKITDTSFETVWNLYGRKDNRAKAEKAWNRLSKANKAKVFAHIPAFIEAHPDKRFRPMFTTYLNAKRYLDEEIISDNKDYATESRQSQRLAAYADTIASIHTIAD